MAQLLLAVIYLSFISLGLPDSLLGSAWPVMHTELGVPVSWSGIIFMIISLGTVISSLASERITNKYGPGKVTAVSVAMTAAAMLGFSFSHSFIILCLLAIPYGLGAGSVDAALNNYVALHYASRHMSWLHCMWGVGASVGPYIMSMALTNGQTWNAGYRSIGLIQIVLTAVLLLSLPLWSANKRSESAKHSLSLKEILNIKGAKAIMLCCFCYCALEQTVGLWASSYLVINRGIDEVTASRFASLFFIGITAGRALSGFLTLKFNDSQMVRLGQIITAIGIACILLPLGNALALGGFVMTGLGCAPIYPSLIHAVPFYFGSDKSQAIIGVQMASAYIGTSFMPPFFGWLVHKIGIQYLGVYLTILLAVMTAAHEYIRYSRAKTQNSL